MTERTRSQQLQAAFSAELEERVQALNRFCCVWSEKTLAAGATRPAPRRWRPSSGRRTASRAAARAVELTDVEQVTHALESTLDAARQSGRQPAQAWFDAVYGAVDTLAALAGRRRQERPRHQRILASLRFSPDCRAGDRQPPGINAGRHPVAAAALPAPGGRRDTPTAARGRGAVDTLEALLSPAAELSGPRLRVEQRLRPVRELPQQGAHSRREWRGSRGLRAGVRRAAGRPEGTEAQTGGTLRRELAGLLRFVERAERRTQTVLDQIEALAVELRHDSAHLGLVTRAIEDAVMGVRLLPVATIFAPFERMVRDLTRESGKEAQLVLTGGRRRSTARSWSSSATRWCTCSAMPPTMALSCRRDAPPWASLLPGRSASRPPSAAAPWRSS